MKLIGNSMMNLRFPINTLAILPPALQPAPKPEQEYYSRLDISYKEHQQQRAHSGNGAASDLTAKDAKTPDDQPLNIWGECVPR